MQEDLKRKKRIEHWEVVTGILMVYDFMTICFEPSNIVVGKKITDTFLKTNYRV